MDDVKHKRVRIPCPDGIEGCAVAHYKWISVEETPKQDKIEVIKEKNGVPTVIKYNGRRYVLDNRN